MADTIDLTGGSESLDLSQDSDKCEHTFQFDVSTDVTTGIIDVGVKCTKCSTTLNGDTLLAYLDALFKVQAMVRRYEENSDASSQEAMDEIIAEIG